MPQHSPVKMALTNTKDGLSGRQKGPASGVRGDGPSKNFENVPFTWSHLVHFGVNSALLR